MNALERRWREELAEAGKAGPSAAIAESIEHAVEAYLNVLDAEAPTLRYTRLAVAEAARGHLEQMNPRPPSVGIVDALSAAWLARVRAEDDGGVLSKQLAPVALAWCEEVAGG
jgi:hypothetical protein